MTSHVLPMMFARCPVEFMNIEWTLWAAVASSAVIQPMFSPATLKQKPRSWRMSKTLPPPGMSWLK